MTKQKGHKKINSTESSPLFIAGGVLLIIAFISVLYNSDIRGLATTGKSSALTYTTQTTGGEECRVSWSAPAGSGSCAGTQEGYYLGELQQDGSCEIASGPWITGFVCGTPADCKICTAGCTESDKPDRPAASCASDSNMCTVDVCRGGGCAHLNQDGIEYPTCHHRCCPSEAPICSAVNGQMQCIACFDSASYGCEFTTCRDKDLVLFCNANNDLQKMCCRIVNLDTGTWEWAQCYDLSVETASGEEIQSQLEEWMKSCPSDFLEEEITIKPTNEKPRSILT